MNRKTIILFFISVFILFGFMPTSSESEVTTRPNLEYKADGLRDPFEGYIAKKEERKVSEVPTQEVSVSPPTLTVQGIIWGGLFPQAIINNKVVKVGDTIEGAQIMDIKKEGIVVSFKNRQYNLSSPAALNLQGLKKLKGGQDEGY